MHEHGLMKAIVEQALRVAEGPVTLVTIRVGELSGSSPGHLTDHFRIATRGTPLENVALRILPCEGSGVRLESIEVDT